MDPQKLDRYMYIDKTPTWLVRGMYAIGIITWFGVIYGYARFSIINPIFFIIIAPIVGFLILYHIVSYLINTCYRQFDLAAHRTLLRRHILRAHSKPAVSIDIFLPICGEDIEVVQRTFIAVSLLQYSNKKVYVLDDKGTPEHKRLADACGFTYLSREDKGHMKKAGNLKHGFERSAGDFIAVFDADFAPHPDFITELLPYMDDPRVAIVQSPQYFQADREVHERSRLEYGAAHIQEDFYRVIQVARDRLGAPVCCGSNALYRRRALDAIGGTVQIDHSEDMYTGFELINAGWRVVYVPIILAIGFCPDGLHSFFHQQHRWCSGSLMLMLDKKFWRSRLSFFQKISFISGFMYYLSYPMTLLLSFQVFFLLIFYKDSIHFQDALPFVPCIIFSFVIIRLFRLTRQRYGGYLARNASIYSYVHAIGSAFLKKSLNWQPTNTKSIDVSSEYMQQMKFAALYLSLYMVCIGLSIRQGAFQIFNINYYVLLFWVFYNVIATTIILFQLYRVLDGKKKKDFFWRLRTAGFYVVGTAGVFFGVLFFPLLHHTPTVVMASDHAVEVVSSSTTVVSKNLGMGDHGQDVLALQKFLNKQGFLVTKSGPGSLGYETTYFGIHTYHALEKLQSAERIPVTGQVDSDTQKVFGTLSD